MSDRAASVVKTIHVDEIGIAYGRHGAHVLKTAYQPIFRPQGGKLTPAGVEGLVKVSVEGQPVDTAQFFAGVTGADRFLVESLCRRLHLRNYHHIGAEDPGVEDLRLFLNFDPRGHTDVETMVEQIRFMLSRLGAHDLKPSQLVCEFTEDRVTDEAMLLRMAAEMRSHGIRLAIDDFGAGHSTPARLDLLEPDIVKFDGAWFRRVAMLAPAVRLLGELVGMLRERGTEVLIEGIETPQQLKVAREAGADLLQGYLLARPALAGTIFSTAPIDPGPLLEEPDNVRPFLPRRRGRGTA